MIVFATTNNSATFNVIGEINLSIVEFEFELATHAIGDGGDDGN